MIAIGAALLFALAPKRKTPTERIGVRNLGAVQTHITRLSAAQTAAPKPPVSTSGLKTGDPCTCPPGTPMAGQVSKYVSSPLGACICGQQGWGSEVFEYVGTQAESIAKEQIGIKLESEYEARASSTTK